MPLFNDRLAHWFREHHGVAATVDLCRLGLSTSQRKTLVSSGVIEELFKGVYHLVSTPLDFEARCAAVCAADESVVTSCFTAGSLLHLRRCGNPRIHATTNRLTKPLGRLVVIHRTMTMPSTDIVVRPDGIRHTTADRLLFDLARHVNALTLESIAEQVVDLRLATREQIESTVRRLAVRGRPGGRRAREVLLGSSGGAADSHDEVVLLRALHSVGLVEFVRQPEVVLPNGDVVHPDLGVPSVGFYVEVDHPEWHSERAISDYDKARDRQIRLGGDEVERVSSDHIRDDLNRVVREIRTLYLRRASQLRR